MYWAKQIQNETEFQNRTGCRTSSWRGKRRANARPKAARTRRKIGGKINGRRYAPPTNWPLKNRKVFYWYGYTTKSEPILSQTCNFGKTTDGSAPRSFGAGKSRKNFPILFIGRAQMNFSKRNENFCGIASPPLGGGGAALATLTSRRADTGGGRRIPSPSTPSFAARKFRAARWRRGRRRLYFRSLAPPAQRGNGCKELPMMINYN